MNITSEMRKYISGQLQGMPVDTLNTEQLERLIDGYYLGGIDAWWTDYVGYPRERTEVTQAVMRAQYRDVTGRNLPTCQRVVTVRSDESTGHFIIALECDHGREGLTRQTITSRTLRLSVFDGWREVERIEIPDPDFHTETTVGQYGSVNTPERYAQKIAEYLTCYRPGSDTQPMDGCYGPTRKDTFRDERRTFKRFATTIGIEVSI